MVHLLAILLYGNVAPFDRGLLSHSLLSSPVVLFGFSRAKNYILAVFIVHIYLYLSRCMVIRQYFTISEGSLCMHCSFAPLMVSTGEVNECFVKKKKMFIVDICTILNY